MPRDVHLVGSVPMASAEEVFETVSAALGPRLKRLPDGETGARGDWITWLEPAFAHLAERRHLPPGHGGNGAGAGLEPGFQSLRLSGKEDDGPSLLQSEGVFSGHGQGRDVVQRGLDRKQGLRLAGLMP